jgi:hypothetical protein
MEGCETSLQYANVSCRREQCDAGQFARHSGFRRRCGRSLTGPHMRPVSDRATPPTEGLPANGETLGRTFRLGRETLSEPENSAHLRRIFPGRCHGPSCPAVARVVILRDYPLDWEQQRLARADASSYEIVFNDIGWSDAWESRKQVKAGGNSAVRSDACGLAFGIASSFHSQGLRT